MRKLKNGESYSRLQGNPITWKSVARARELARNDLRMFREAVMTKDMSRSEYIENTMGMKYVDAKPIYSGQNLMDGCLITNIDVGEKVTIHIQNTNIYEDDSCYPFQGVSIQLNDEQMRILREKLNSMEDRVPRYVKGE